MANKCKRWRGIGFLLTATLFALGGLMPVAHATVDISTEQQSAAPAQQEEPVVVAHSDAPDEQFSEPYGDMGEAPQNEDEHMPEPTAAPTPEPDETQTPTPSATESPTESPEPSATPEMLPEALETPADQSVVIASLYWKAADTAVRGENRRARLVLTVENPSGTALRPFGLSLQLDAVSRWWVDTINAGDHVRLLDDTLWIDSAHAEDGRVVVDGEALDFALGMIPFPQGGEDAAVTISLTFLDENGNGVALSDRDEPGREIRMAHTFSLTAATAAEENPTDATPQPAEPNPETPAPEPTDSENLAEFLTTEPDPSAEATPEPTPEPLATAVIRQLLLHANIPYEDLRVGDLLTLSAEMIGYAGLNTTLIWQQYIDGVWYQVPDARDLSLTILITPANRHNAWRYDVTVAQ